MFLQEIKVKHSKFGSLTQGQRNIIISIAKENGIIKDPAIKQQIIEYQPPTEVKESVFSEDERKEIFNFIKDSASGKYSKEDVEKYSKLISNQLKERGIE